MFGALVGFFPLGQATAWAQTPLVALTAANLYAQNTQIEQARLFDRPPGTENVGVTADGTPLPDTGATSDDDSFGAQQILKSQERAREFVLTGNAAVFYTNNVALTPHSTIDDAFFVATAGIAWNKALSSEVQMQIGAGASFFRYFDTTSLDFENLGGGIGFTWAPRNWNGIGMFARYDFAELLDTHSNEILQDHEFSLGLQKTFVLGRSHAVTLGVTGSAGISDPFAAQRDQVAGFIGYQVALTRQLQAEALFRAAGNFYNGDGRNDYNQILSIGLHYRVTNWAELNALFSWGLNRSSHSTFDYDVLNTGGGVGLTLRF